MDLGKTVRPLGKDLTGESYIHFFDSLPYGSVKPLYTSGQDSWGQMPLEASFVLYRTTEIVCVCIVCSIYEGTAT
jgi:hypothetical protein